MEIAKKNFIKYCIQTTAYAVAAMFLNGVIIQSFLLFVGLDEAQVYTYTSLSQLAQVGVMALMIFISGRIKRGRQLSAFSNLLMLIPLALLIFGSVDPLLFTDTYVLIFFVVSFIVFGGIGLYSVLMYCLPFQVIDIADFGKFTGISGALAGVASFAVSSLYTAIISCFDYLGSMTCFFILAVLCAALSSVMFFTMKNLPDTELGNNQVSRSDVLAVFKNRDTYLLIVPNFSRGLATGIFNVIAIMAVSSGVTDTTGASAFNIVLQVSSFAASLIFVFLYRKLSIGRMIIFATVGVCTLLPFSFTFGFVGFIILMLFALFFRCIIDSAIPTALIKIIPENQMGAYSSIRMLTLTAAQAVAAALVLPLVNTVGYVGVLIFASVMQLICGLGHFWVIRSHNIKT